MSEEADGWPEHAAAWSDLERRFNALVVKFAALAYSLVLGLIVFPGPAAIVAFMGLMLLFCFGMVVQSRCDAENCRNWRELCQSLHGALVCRS